MSGRGRLRRSKWVSRALGASPGNGHTYVPFDLRSGAAAASSATRLCDRGIIFGRPGLRVRS
jgi:hypothetical protein